MELEIWDRVLEPVPMLFIGLVSGAVIFGILVYFLMRGSVAKEKRRLRYINTTNGVSNSVLNIVQMGVVVFTERGQLLYHNKTCLKKLRVEELPSVFTEFVSTFIPDPQVILDLRLYEDALPSERKAPENDEDPQENEKIESVTTRVEIRNRIIQFHFSKPFFPQSDVRGWIVVIEDVTKMARQEQQRRLFVSTVSHELKTPLATITGYSESLIDWGIREMDREKLFSYLLKIKEESDRLDAIIKNLTFLSQIENNKVRVNMMQFRVEQVVENVVRRMRAEGANKNITIGFECLTNNMPHYFGSDTMLEQMVVNLINNAIKYSDVNTQIWVFIQAHETTITIKVQDQGPGIPKPAAEKVFQAFFRVDETGSRKAGGSGLGLAIVKMLSEVLEGEVSLVTRTAEDDAASSMRSEVGSDFYITLPTAETTFRETLIGLREGVPREEVLYRKAQAYIEKFNEDEYDLGYDFTKITDEQAEDLIERLTYMDDCDNIDRVGDNAIPMHTASSMPMVEPQAETVPAQYAPQPVSEPAYEPAPEIVPVPVPVTQPEQEVPQYVPEPVPVVPEPVPIVPEPVPVVPEIVPAVPVPIPVEPQQASMVQEMPVREEPAESGQWVTLSSRETKVLVPDPPVLKKPILSKDQVGLQNAQTRKQAKTKKTAAKRAVSKDKTEKKPAVGEKSEVSPAPPVSRSLLRQVTETSLGKNAENSEIKGE